MATSSWLSTYPIISRLIKEPQKFDFVQAIRLLEFTGLLEDLSAVGSIQNENKSQHKHLKARFVGDFRLRFPVAAITQAVNEDNNCILFTVSGFGYLGAIGVLPYSYSSLINTAESNKNYGLKSFLDIFQHRSVSLFYKASCKYRITISYDRGKKHERDHFKNSLDSIIGFGLTRIKDRLSIPDESLIYYSGFLSSSLKTIYALENILSDELNIKVNIRPFSGRWLRLDPSDQTIVSNFTTTAQYNILGIDAVLGERVWSVQNCFRIMVGPINQDRIWSLLPKGIDEIKVSDIVKTYCGYEYEYDLQLIIEAKSVPFSRLGWSQGNEEPCRLGQTSWVLSSSSLIDRKDAIFINED
jgi:type VI secretion system protein ImpH